jgi:hypothetical protein
MAEELVNLSHRPSVRSWRRKAVRERAAVHATLALVAATALARHNFETGPPQADKDAWYRAASEGPGYKQRIREAEAAEEREFDGQ